MRSLIVFIVCILSLESLALDVTLNTQLDRKLESLAQKEESAVYKLNVLRELEIKGLKAISEQTVLNEITVFKGDILDPYIINRNIKRVEALGFFESVNSNLVDFKGGKKWIITIVENPIISSINFSGNTSIVSQNLLEIIKSKEGEIFSFKNVREDINSIEKDYETKGYLFTKVKMNLVGIK